MKHLILIIALVILTKGFFSLGFAGDEGRSATSTQIGNKLQQLPPTDLDGPREDRVSSTKSFDWDMANPQATPMVAGFAKLTQPTPIVAGVYTIPGNIILTAPGPTLYASNIATAVAYYNAFGIAGNVTFNLTQTAYNEPTGITFVNNVNTATGAVLTIQPAVGVAVTVNFAATVGEGKGFSFNGARNVTIDGINTTGRTLTLRYAGGTFPSNDLFAATVYITGNSRYIAVKNATIHGNIEGAFETQTNGRAAIFLYAATGQQNQDITIDGCTIINATFGFKSLQQFTAPAFFISANNVWFTNNKVGGAFGGKVLQGMLTEATFGFRVNNNIFDGIEVNDRYYNLPNSSTIEYDALRTFNNPSFLFNFGKYSAIHVYNVDNISTCLNNQIWSVSNTNPRGFLVYGITWRISNGGRSLVANNRITNITNLDNTGQTLGFSTTNMNIYQNTVRLTGDRTGLPSHVSTCMNNDGASVIRNNVFSNEITGGTASNTRGVNASSVIDYCAIFSTGWWTTQSPGTVNAAVDAGCNLNGIFGNPNLTSDLHITAGPSSAENIGFGGLYSGVDIDAESRHATAPDAGADEFTNTGVPVVVDVLPSVISPPMAGGVPAGVAVIPRVQVKNNSADPQIFNVRMEIPLDAYDNTVTITVPTRATATTPASGVGAFPEWMPTGSATRTLTVTTILGTDGVPGNDVISRTQPVIPPVTLTTDYYTNFNTPAARTGWSATGDFAAAGAGGWTNTNFTKLGGVFDDDASPLKRWSWVSKPGPASPGWAGYSTAHPTRYYYSDRLLSQVISPFFDLSGMTGDVYVRFVHSIDVEPKWDRSWMWYTIDGGTSWHVLGDLNDTNGINWYDDKVYKNALSGINGETCLDITTWNALVGLPVPQPGWSSNYLWKTCGWGGIPFDPDTNTGGPHGWVYVQIKLPPALQRAPLIRFAYATFADAWYCDDGWAFDAFMIGSPIIFAGGTISGTVFHDLNGNGTVEGGEADGIGTKVYLSYYGVLKDSTPTDANGVYTFTASQITIPGVYSVRTLKPGNAWTIPFGTIGIADVNHPATGQALTQNLGYYKGSMTGLKFSDLANNGVYDPGVDPPLSGWTIQLHKDSANGPLIGSAVTAENGTYSILAPAYFPGPGKTGNYVVKEIKRWYVPLFRQTFPAAPGTHTIQMTGTSGSTNIVADINFGNFIYAVIRVEAVIDVNGDGIKQLPDQIAIPEGDGKMTYEFWKGTTKVATFDLAGGVESKTFYPNDVGPYIIKRISPVIPYYKETFPSEQTVVVDSSQEDNIVTFGYYKYVTVTGKKFEVKEGNPGLAGWTIYLTGGKYFGDSLAITDVNGNYSIDSVGPSWPLKHIINEVLKTGWTKISPLSPYQFEAASGHLPANNPKNRDFGNFKNVSISGVKYRDFNGNCIADGQDYGISCWNVTLDPGAQTVKTDVNGGYIFTNLGPGTYTVTEEVKEGFVTECATSHNVTVVSGTDVLGKNFFNSGSVDDKEFRTFISTLVVDAACKKEKPKKDWTAKKPTVPNYANLVSKLVNKSEQLIMVGESGQKNAGGKIKAYFHPKAYGDVWKTLCDNSIRHDGPARGFDVNNKGGLMLKRWASVSPNKKNNKLVQELTILDINIWASDTAITPSGFGDLCYHEPGNALHGMSINAIAAYADNIMTNWEGVPYTTYDNLYYVAGRINAAFYGGFGYDATQWNTARSKLYFPGVRSLNEVEYLRACTGGAPIATPPAPEPLPTVYALGQNYPNPFNPTTTVSFDLPFTSIVTLKIYNMLGQEVGTLLNREEFEAGVVEETFDASTLASGIYLYRIVAEQIDDEGVGQTFTQMKKMVLIR